MPRRSPVWSARSIFWLAALDIALTAALVFLLGHKTLFAEVQITLAIVAGALFIFLATGLYCGLRVKRETVSVPPPSKRKIELPLGDAVDVGVDSADFSLDATGDEGCFVAILLWLLVMAAIFLLFWLFETGALAALMIAIYWLFSRALRQVFARGRFCRRKFWHSIGYAAGFTALYTGWLFALSWLIRLWMN